MRRNYQRFCTVSIEEVQKEMQAGKEFMIVQGERVDLTSNRIRTYVHETTCAYCGQTADYFAVERDSMTARQPWNRFTGYHLNLYGHGPLGNEVMITSDHIIPRSTGGPEGVHNRQPLCERCNSEKSNYADVQTARWMRAVELTEAVPQALRQKRIVRIFSEQVHEAPAFHIEELDNGHKQILVDWRDTKRVFFNTDPESPDHVTSRQLRSRVSVESSGRFKRRRKREKMEAMV